MARQNDRRSGQTLAAALQVRLSWTQHAYLAELAEQNGTSVSEELRRCVDEAMVATIEARRERRLEVQRAVDAIESGTADPEDFPHLFTRVRHGADTA